MPTNFWQTKQANVKRRRKQQVMGYKIEKNTVQETLVISPRNDYKSQIGRKTG